MANKKGKGPDIKQEEVKEAEIILKGEFSLADSSTYAGEYKELNGTKLRWGTGTNTCGPDVYTGAWENDAMNGQGEYVFASGAKYVGGFKDNLFNGEGTYQFSDGSSYTGRWQNNKMHGFGVYVDAHGAKYEGEFHNGQFSSESYVSLRPVKRD